MLRRMPNLLLRRYRLPGRRVVIGRTHAQRQQYSHGPDCHDRATWRFGCRARQGRQRDLPCQQPGQPDAHEQSSPRCAPGQTAARRPQRPRPRSAGATGRPRLHDAAADGGCVGAARETAGERYGRPERDRERARSARQRPPRQRSQTARREHVERPQEHRGEQRSERGQQCAPARAHAGQQPHAARKGAHHARPAETSPSAGTQTASANARGEPRRRERERGARTGKRQDEPGRPERERSEHSGDRDAPRTRCPPPGGARARTASDGAARPQREIAAAQPPRSTSTRRGRRQRGQAGQRGRERRARAAGGACGRRCGRAAAAAPACAARAGRAARWHRRLPRARARSAVALGRRRGCDSSARAQAAASERGRSGRRSPSERGGCLWRSRSSSGVRARNGLAPVSAS